MSDPMTCAEGVSALNAIVAQLNGMAEWMWSDPDGRPLRSLCYDMSVASAAVQSVADQLSALAASVDS